MRQPVRFVLNELRDLPTLRPYQLRGTGLIAQVRHPLLDMWGIEEMFRFRVYEPPPPVARQLRSLPRAVRVVDLGGHVGLFGLFALGLFPDSSITSFEPDPGNVEVLRRCVEANALRGRWQVIEACATTSDGTAEFASSFHLSRLASSSDPGLDDLHHGIGSAFPFLQGTALLTAERRQVTCRDVFPFLADADLIKIDIEGSEWEILADPRFAELDALALVLEYHPAYWRADDAEAEVRRALNRAGYETMSPARGADGATMWAWKPARPTS